MYLSIYTCVVILNAGFTNIGFAESQSDDFPAELHLDNTIPSVPETSYATHKDIDVDMDDIIVAHNTHEPDRLSNHISEVEHELTHPDSTINGTNGGLIEPNSQELGNRMNGTHGSFNVEMTSDQKDNNHATVGSSATELMLSETAAIKAVSATSAKSAEAEVTKEEKKHFLSFLPCFSAKEGAKETKPKPPQVAMMDLVR